MNKTLLLHCLEYCANCQIILNLLFKGTAYEEPILVSKDGAKIVFNLGTYTGNRYHSLANTLEQLKTPLDNSVDISVKVYEGDLFQGLVEVTFTKP